MTSVAEGPIDLAAADLLLSTTRAVRRRLDFDRPVERAVLLDCVGIAQQAPTGGNAQGWSWVMVTDADKRAAVADNYRDASTGYFAAMTAADGQTKVAGMSADAIADVVTTYARPLGWDLAPHDLRRTFAKLARSGQAPLEQIQLALGHQNIQTTQRYLGSELNLVDAACDRLGIRL